MKAEMRPTPVLMRYVNQRIDVVLALILRDMRTRFGRSHLSYLVAVAWPLTHMVVIVVSASLTSKVIPIGTSQSVFVSTGVLPYILCLYPARMMMVAIEPNKSLLNFPVVKILDLLIAKAIIEFVTAFSVILIFYIGVYFADVDIIPNNLATWACAILMTIYLAISMGILNAVMVTLTRAWIAVFIGAIVISYVLSGAFFLPSAMPQGVRDVIWYNPMFHCVEWLRSAFYEGYGDDELSKAYVFWFATCLLLLGLVGERFARGKLLSS
ncbi:ABC transporter permease [Ensifer sp. ENS06]|uniref:ABC transporter permease n=1 Tax=Ensifer sp. ENS06 TaxID=2769276 RepID=UPI00177D3006|nr:ABC transporter permease [Ensifer sp. ENS06]MBD9625274.1 ABC transporter permease [Ensifer sp. ENS06]